MRTIDLKKVSAVLASFCLLLFAAWPIPFMKYGVISYSPKAYHYLPFLCFLLGLGALVFHSLSLCWTEGSPRAEIMDKSRTNTLKPAIALILSGVILGHVATQFAAPLHWEDHRHLSMVVNYGWAMINPLLRTENHPLTNLAALISVNVFGMSKFAIKLPALLFTLGFLAVLARFCFRFASPFTGALIFLHFATNQMALWYMHSMRGYILAMLVCSLMFLLMREVTLRSPRNPKLSILLFLSLCLISCCTHLFATLFSGLSVLSLIFWTAWNRSQIQEAQRNHIKKIILYFLTVIVPIYALVLIKQFSYLHQLGDLFQGGFPSLSTTLIHLFGSSVEWAGRAMVVFLIGLGVIRFRKVGNRIDWATLFLITAITFFGVVLSLLQVRLVETRFLLPFVFPVIYWVGESVSKISQTSLSLLAKAAAVFLFIFVPIYSEKSLYEHLTLNIRDFEEFIQQVRAETAPIEKSCYTFAGEPNLILFSRSLYLSRFDGVSNDPAQCTQKYHIYFESPSELPPTDTRLVRNLHYRTVINKDNKYLLYRETMGF